MYVTGNNRFQNPRFQNKKRGINLFQNPQSKTKKRDLTALFENKPAPASELRSKSAPKSRDDYPINLFIESQPNASTSEQDQTGTPIPPTTPPTITEDKFRNVIGTLDLYGIKDNTYLSDEDNTSDESDDDRKDQKALNAKKDRTHDQDQMESVVQDQTGSVVQDQMELLDLTLVHDYETGKPFLYEFNPLTTFDPNALYYPEGFITVALKQDKCFFDVDNLFNDVLRDSSNRVMELFYEKMIMFYEGRWINDFINVLDQMDATGMDSFMFFTTAVSAVMGQSHDMYNIEIPYLFLILAYFNISYEQSDPEDVLENIINQILEIEKQRLNCNIGILSTDYNNSIQEFNIKTRNLLNYLSLDNTPNISIPEGPQGGVVMDQNAGTKTQIGGGPDECNSFNSEINDNIYATVSVLSEIFHDFIPSRCNIDPTLRSEITKNYNKLIINLIASADGVPHATAAKLQTIANGPNIESNYFNALASEQIAACDSSNISYDKFTLLTIKTYADANRQSQEDYDSEIAILENLAANYSGYVILPKTNDVIAISKNAEGRYVLDLHLYIYSPKYFPAILTDAFETLTSARYINLTDMSPVHDELAQQYNKKALFEAGNTDGTTFAYVNNNLDQLLDYLGKKKDAIANTIQDGSLPAAGYHKAHDVNSIAGILDSCGSAQPAKNVGENIVLIQPLNIYTNFNAAFNGTSAATTDPADPASFDQNLIQISNTCMSDMLSIWAPIQITRHDLVTETGGGALKAKGARFYAQTVGGDEVSFELHSRDTTVANVSDCIMYCKPQIVVTNTIADIGAIADTASTNVIFTRLIKATLFILRFCTTDNTNFNVNGVAITLNDLFFMVLAFLKSCGDKYQILTCNEISKLCPCMFHTKDKLCALGALVSDTPFTSSFVLGQELIAQIEDATADACPLPVPVKLRSSTDTGYLSNRRDLFFTKPDYTALNELILPIILDKITGPPPASSISIDTGPTARAELLLKYPVKPDTVSLDEETKYYFHKNLLSALKYYETPIAESNGSSDLSMSVAIPTPTKPQASELIDAEIKQAVYANLNDKNINFLKAANKRIQTVGNLKDTMFEYINQDNLVSGLRMAYLNAANIVENRIDDLITVLRASIKDSDTTIIDYHNKLKTEVQENVHNFNRESIDILEKNIKSLTKSGTIQREPRTAVKNAIEVAEAKRATEIAETKKTTNKQQSAIQSVAAGITSFTKSATKKFKKAQDVIESAAKALKDEIALKLQVEAIRKKKTTVETFRQALSFFQPSSGGYPRKNLIKNKNKNKTTVKKYKKRVKKYTIKKFKKNAAKNLRRTIKHNKKYKKRTTIRA